MLPDRNAKQFPENIKITLIIKNMSSYLLPDEALFINLASTLQVPARAKWLHIP